MQIWQICQLRKNSIIWNDVNLFFYKKCGKYTFLYHSDKQKMCKRKCRCIWDNRVPKVKIAKNPWLYLHTNKGGHFCSPIRRIGISSRPKCYTVRWLFLLQCTITMYINNLGHCCSQCINGEGQFIALQASINTNNTHDGE